MKALSPTTIMSGRSTVVEERPVHTSTITERSTLVGGERTTTEFGGSGSLVRRRLVASGAIVGGLFALAALSRGWIYHKHQQTHLTLSARTNEAQAEHTGRGRSSSSASSKDDDSTTIKAAALGCDDTFAHGWGCAVLFTGGEDDDDSATSASSSSYPLSFRVAVHALSSHYGANSTATWVAAEVRRFRLSETCATRPFFDRKQPASMERRVWKEMRIVTTPRTTHPSRTAPPTPPPAALAAPDADRAD